MKKINFLTSLLLAISIVACNNKSNEQKIVVSEDTQQPQTEIVNASTTENSGQEIKIEINSNDQMQFDKNEIKVKAGQKVVLTLNHTGKSEKTSMGHNFVLLKSGTDLADFCLKSVNEKDKEYIYDESLVIAHTKVIGGGESDTIEFTAPEAGSYDYACSFPGHYSMMKGKFIVE